MERVIMSHEVNTLYEESLMEWMEEDGWDDILNLEEMTVEQMQHVQDIRCYYKDPDEGEKFSMEYLEDIAEKKPKLMKEHNGK